MNADEMDSSRRCTAVTISIQQRAVLLSFYLLLSLFCLLTALRTTQTRVPSFNLPSLLACLAIEVELEELIPLVEEVAVVEMVEWLLLIPAELILKLCYA